jgi:hypothetical protein
MLGLCELLDGTLGIVGTIVIQNQVVGIEH